MPTCLEAPALAGVFRTALSPDGRNLYVTDDDEGVAILGREIGMHH
jgi:hypothetical protein